MPEMKVTAVNPRQATRDAQQARLRLATEGRAQTVKVFAANEDMRRALRHANGTRFRAELDQPVEWPNDSFTSRRIADGSVRTDGAASADAAEPDETLNPREQAEARKPKSAAPKKPEPNRAGHHTESPKA